MSPSIFLGLIPIPKTAADTGFGGGCAPSNDVIQAYVAQVTARLRPWRALKRLRPAPQTKNGNFQAVVRRLDARGVIESEAVERRKSKELGMLALRKVLDGQVMDC